MIEILGIKKLRNDNVCISVDMAGTPFDIVVIQDLLDDYLVGNDITSERNPYGQLLRMDDIEEDLALAGFVKSLMFETRAVRDPFSAERTITSRLAESILDNLGEEIDRNDKNILLSVGESIGISLVRRGNGLVRIGSENYEAKLLKPMNLDTLLLLYKDVVTRNAVRISFN